MKKLLIFLVLVGFTQLSYSQSLIQTFTDRCTGETKVFSIAMEGSTTVVFYNKSRSFTAADVQSGVFQAWLEETYSWWLNLSPCSTNQSSTTNTQTTTQNTTSNATNAANNATSSTNTTSTNTSSTSTTNTNTSGTTDSGSTGSTNTSSNSTSNNTSSGTDSGSTDNSNTNTNDTSNGNSSSDSGSSDSGGTSDSGSTDNSSEGSGSKDNSSDSSSGDSGSGDSSGDGDGSSSDSSGGEEGDNSDKGGDSSEGDSGEGDSGDNSEEGSGDSDDTSDDSKDNESSEEESKSESKEEESKDEEVEEKKEEEKKEESEEEKKDEDKEESDEESEEDSEEESDEEESDDEESEEDEEEDSEEESDNEEEEEDEEDEKKKRLAPPIISANLMTMQMLDGTISTAASFGISQSSLTGVDTYSLNTMIWSNLKQFMLGGSKSTVYFKYDRKQPRMLVDPDTGEYHEFGYTMEKGSIWSIDSHAVNFMYMFGTTMATYTYSQVYMGQKDNFWKGFVGGYAATVGIINSFGKVSSSNSITGFGTKPFNFKKLPRWTFSPMVAVSLPLRIMPLDLKVDPFNNFTYIVGNSMNFAISQRFVANLGITTISNTDKNIPMTFAATIGTRFAF